MALKLSKKYGVNPSVGVCFWCGEGKEVILFGSDYNRGEEAPKEILANYDPCDKCKKFMAMGITIIEAEEHQTKEKFPSIQKTADDMDIYPTGRWFVVTEDYITKTFNKEIVEVTLKERKAFMPRWVVNILGLSEIKPTHTL